MDESLTNPGERVSAILLAAGESRRMGRLKQLLPFGRKTVVETCLDTLLACKFLELIVVLGHSADKITEVIEPYPIKIVVNSDYQLGMGSSIRAGVMAANPFASAYLIALVDQPLISIDLIRLVLKIYAEDSPKIIIPRYGAKGGHPTVFAASLREDIIRMDLGIGLRQVRDRYIESVRYLSIDDPLVVADMDYWEEYLEQGKIWQERHNSKDLS